MEEMSRRLIEEFTGNYFEKLFYFCLKKTGDSYEAEELASDITLNIVTALQKGTIPTSFSGWVWQIARNRYSAWADRRHKSRELDSGADIGEIELADENADIEKAWMRSEDLRLLRRELSFITSDYRDIIVAYYIEDKSVKDIGKLLGLPDGTVKSKLFRAREMLKEGMNMAREFGAMSYRPEQVSFSCSCDSFGDLGEPWTYLNRLLCKNILMAAYRTPSTAEELAVEIGVALPYMEDELRRLTGATLMREKGKKYESSFFILSARAQDKIYSHLNGLVPELTERIIEALEYRISCLETNGVSWHEGYQSYEDMKWALLLQETEKVVFSVWRDARPAANGSSGKAEFTVRPNNGRWDIIGYEEYEGVTPSSVGHHGSCMERTGYEKLVESGIQFGQYRIGYQRIDEMTPDWLSYDEVDTLGRLARKEKEGLSEAILERLQELGYVRKTDNQYEPAIMVSCRDKQKPLTEAQEEEYKKLLEKAKEIAGLQYEFVKKVILEEVPEFLREDSHQINFAIEHIFSLNGAVLEEAVRRGYLTYDKDEGRRMLGIYMTV